MEINTILIIGNMIISALTVCQRSRCTDIEVSDCIKIHRDVPREHPPSYGEEELGSQM
jgi:hypothetical protein